jgi:peptide/nickel transport system substrate-binding protein
MSSFLRAVVVAGLLATSAAPVLAQKSKDTLRYPVQGTPALLDRYLETGPFANSWEPSVFDNLLGFDSAKQIFEPLLAKSWTQPDPATYVLELRDDVKWHDGHGFDADDVVYTLNYLIDPDVTLRFKSNWAWIKSVEKLGPYTVRITAKEPVPYGMMWLAFSTPIYPKHLHAPLANKQDFGAHPVGTGPYRITRLDKNGIVAERYADFRPGPTKPAAAIGRVVAEAIQDSGTLVASLLAGKIDIAEDLPPDQAAALRASGHFEVTLSPLSIAYNFIGFPTTGWASAKPLADVRVRLAIAKAVDRKALVDAQFGEVEKGVEPPAGLCAKEQLGCGFTRTYPDYDPAGARKLLAEAGYPDGFDVVISTFRLPSNVAEATAIAGMLREIGIRATVSSHLIANRLQLISQGKVQIGYYGWSGGGMFEVSPQIVRHFDGNEYVDPVLTKMAGETFSIMNDAERRAAVAKVMDYANEHAYAFPLVPSRPIFTHTKEVELKTTALRATQVYTYEFGWK